MKLHAYDKIIEPLNYKKSAEGYSKYFEDYDTPSALEDNAIDTEKEVLQMMDLYPSNLNPDRTRNTCYGNNTYYKVSSSMSISPINKKQYIKVPNPTEKITGLRLEPIFIKSYNQKIKGMEYHEQNFRFF